MKFAHLNVQAIKQMILKEMVSGMQSLKLDDFKEPLNCIACSTAKRRWKAYERHHKHSKVCYDRLMSGVCSIGIETLGGNRYFQLVQDEASRYKWCYLLEHKSEATINMMNLILRLEKKHEINRLTFDRGREFVNNKMKNFPVDHGIELKPTNAYTPEEKCLVEKRNGNMINRFDQGLSGKTPYKKLTGMKPDVSNLRVCGCVAFAHIVKKKRANKLSSKAVPTLFLGFSQSSLGYRLLNFHTGELIERRDLLSGGY
ncbi:Gag-pol Polyprotein [Phytophthora megakarya]|uniref:Gag-pol Polyprotein n=1 Tax=Phytophthora megakarya TaxID=4795 RepID=A0A225W5F0_9STRA|nr:Gag-pol Polyprotein [Phytophthora megakarya]